MSLKVSAITNNNDVSLDALTVARRLQSLGIEPTGNLGTDRAILQRAEVQKKQNTLASNSVQNLKSLDGTNNDFGSALQSIGGTQVQSINGLTEQKNAEIGSEMLGAQYLAEWNKYQLGLTA